MTDGWGARPAYRQTGGDDRREAGIKNAPKTQPARAVCLLRALLFIKNVYARLLDLLLNKPLLLRLGRIVTKLIKQQVYYIQLLIHPILRGKAIIRLLHPEFIGGGRLLTLNVNFFIFNG